MFNAVSMYLGGAFVTADSCDYHDYKRLGLRCPECGEPVYLKRGYTKSPHFSHYKKTNVECSQRLEGFIKNNWQSLGIEGKEQRKELFKLYFLKIIKNTFNDFDLIAKNLEADEKSFTQEICSYFRILKPSLSNIKIPVSSGRNNQSDDWDKDSALQYLIVAEVIDYLCLEESKKILELVVLHITQEENSHELSVEIKNSFCLKIREMLLKVDWKTSFSEFSPDSDKQLEVQLEINDGESYYWTGYNYYANNEFNLAIPYLTKAIEVNYDDNQIHPYKMRAYCYRELERYQESIADSSKLIILYCDKLKNYLHHQYLEHSLMRAYLQRACTRIMDVKNRKNDLIFSDIYKAIDIGKELLEKYLKYEDEKEKNKYTEITKEQISDAYQMLAQFYRELEVRESSIEYYSKAINNYPSSPVDELQETRLINLAWLYNNRAWQYFEYADFLSAIMDYDKSINLCEHLESDPEIWKNHISAFYINRFICFCRAKLYEQALDGLSHFFKKNIIHKFDNYDDFFLNHKEVLENYREYLSEDIHKAQEESKESHDAKIAIIKLITKQLTDISFENENVT